MITCTPISRRGFLARTALATAAGAAVTSPAVGWAAESTAPRLKLALTPGSIGVRANQTEAITLADEFGFDAVEPYPDFLARLSSDEMAQLLETMKAKGLAWAAAGLPVEFRRDETALAEGLKRLPDLATAMQQAGVTRVGTWLMPGHGTLTYVQNFQQHARRLRAVAQAL